MPDGLDMLFLMPSLDESVTKTKQWPIWVGSDADFRRLLRLMEKAVEPLVPSHVEQETEHPRNMAEYPADRLKALEIRAKMAAEEGHPAHYDEEIAKVKAELEGRLAAVETAEAKARRIGLIDLSLTSKDDDRRKVTGTADELSEYLDGRHIQELEITAPSGYFPGYTITARAGRDSGLYVRVSSKDANWALSAASEIEAEASRHVPGWRILRSAYILFPLYLIAIGSLVYFIFDEVARRTTAAGTFDEPLKSIAYVAFLVVSIFGAGVAVDWTKRYVPAFEIVHSGGRSRGKALLAFIGSAVAAVVLGIVGNGISNAIFNSAAGG
jgi:hypothetical protein